MIDQFIDGRKQSRLESVGLKDPDTTFFIENNFDLIKIRNLFLL